MEDTKPITPPKMAGKEIGQSGTLIFQGNITSEEYNRSLTGDSLIKKVEVMRRSSSTVRATLLVVKLPVMSAKWDIEPAKDEKGEVSPNDEIIANFVRRELFHRNVNFFDFLRQGTSFFDFGFSVFEKVYEPTTYQGKTRIGIAKLGFRKQSTIFKWEMNDGKPGISQMIGNGNRFDIPKEKLIIFTNEKEGDNYEGISLLRYAHKDWDMLDKLTIVNAIALEKMSIGVPIVTARENQTPSTGDLAKAEEVLQNFRANEQSFMDIPSTMMVEMLDMKASTTKEIIPTLNYHDRRISQAILAQFMDLGGSSGSGSQSLSKDLTSLFMKSEEAAAKTIQSTINEQLVRQLCDFNFSDLPNGYPTITFGSIADDDLSETATSLGTLAEKQLITPDIDLEGHLREKYNLPAMTKEAREKYIADKNTPEDQETGKPAEVKKTQDKTLVEKPKPTKPANIKADALIQDVKRAKQRLLDVIVD